MKFSLLSRNLLKLSYLSAVFFSISSCSKKNDIVEKKRINTEYANDKYLYNIYKDPFDPKFIHDLEKIIDIEQPVQIKKIKRMLNKLKKTEELTDDESKYSAILELAKALPEKFLIDERHQYNNKYQFLIEQLNSYYNKTAKAIPKEVHFIWLGGPLGEIQKDYVKAMHLIINHDTPDDFVVSTMQTHSVREMVQYVFDKLDLDTTQYVSQDPKFVRPEELKYLKGDSTKIRTLLGWEPEYTFETLMDDMINGWFNILDK
jgi:hypothetical protein